MASERRAPLVLVPGLMCTAELYRDQMAALGELADIHVACHRRAADLPAIVRQILAAAPPSFSLAGLSMGGYIAFEMLRQAPERIVRLALLDTNARADRPEQAGLRQLLIGMAKAVGVRAAQSALMPHLIHKARLSDRQLVDRVLSMADGTGAAAFERQQRAILGRPDNRPFLPSITCPTTIIVGAEDALTPVKVHEELAAGIAGSTLHVIENCGHLSTMEQPEAVNTILLGWLQGASADNSSG